MSEEEHSPVSVKAILRAEVLTKLQDEIKEIEENIEYIFNYFHITKVPKYFDKKVEFISRDLIELVDQIDALTNHYHERIVVNSNKLSKIDQELERLNLALFSLKMLKEQDFRTDTLDHFKHFSFHLYSTYTENVVRLQYLLAEANIPFYFHENQYSEDRTIFYIIAGRKHDEEIQRLLKVQNCERIDLPYEFIHLDGIHIEECEMRIRDVNMKYFQVTQELENFKEQRLRDFVAAREVLTNLKNFLHIEQQCVVTRGYVILETWIPTAEVEAIRTRLEKHFQSDIRLEQERHQKTDSDRSAENQPPRSGLPARPGQEPPKKATKIPSLMKHGRFVRPFETLLGLYGVPNYKEIDPTVLVAIFFPVFFGLMFGDVGHGIVLVIVGILANFKYRNKRGKQDSLNFGRILIYCGIGAIFGGFLYGEFMGHHIHVGGEPFSLFVNPMESPGALMDVFKLCILLGVIHINVGWLIALLNYWRTGQKYLALTDSLVKIVVLSLGTYLIFHWGFNIDAWLAGSFPPILMVVIPALLFIVFRPLGKLFRVKDLSDETYGKLIGEGGMEAFELFLSILSNVASYSRIFALLMAHIGLMSVIQAGADLVEIQGVGGAILVQIGLIFGNAFVIVLETLLVMIQDLRLQFYEFFSKFYKGNGVPFSAMKLQEQYSRIVFEPCADESAICPDPHIRDASDLAVAGDKKKTGRKPSRDPPRRGKKRTGETSRE